MNQKPPLSFWQIWNMSFGFLGIQYGFGLQQANMSPIYRYLGADEASIPALWLAGPVTGLIVQPIIGAMSDRTWGRWGRRKPYFMIGALITSAALFLMPYSSALWMAAGLMWLLDSGLNITQEPFRAFVADKLPALPPSQRTLGFAMQSFFVGFGQTLANLMPFLLPLFGIALVSDSDGRIPLFVKLSFIIGAVVVLVTVWWTIRTTDEYPPDDMEAFKKLKAEPFGIAGIFKEVGQALLHMPPTMKQLWWVKFFTWFGLPLMWQYLSLAIARHTFLAPDASVQPGFNEGTRWGSMAFAVFNVACFSVAFLLPRMANLTSRRATHALCLCLGAIGFFLTLFIGTNKYPWLISMFLVGISWASILTMPYALLANAVPSGRIGVYMGIFNMFIVVPQIVNMVSIPFLYKSILGNDPRNALVLCGVCMLIAGLACFGIREERVQLR